MQNTNYNPDISDMRFEIEQFIEQYSGTMIGWEIKNRWREL